MAVLRGRCCTTIGASLSGASSAAWIAAGIAVVAVVQTLWLRRLPKRSA
ncbi:MAG: hypothetical protein M3485_04790 [Pseudomonadota bacterium]|nr:hypothetical protein [Pseudomonadota bacterium]